MQDMIRIGKRSLGNFLYQFTMLENYRALCRFPLVHEEPWRIFKDELLSRHVYPRTLGLRTPIGKISVRLHHVADLSTLNLIFSREDYLAPADSKVVLDVGANIGLSALYFLSRNPDAHVYAYEPAPPTFTKLVDNLAPFEQRVSLKSAAVSDFRGSAILGLEESGVYSAIDRPASEQVEVECLHIMDVLEDILSQHGHIDILKLDCEGHEGRILQAIDDSIWSRIGCINVDAVFDCPEVKEFVPSSYRMSQRGTALRFVQKG